MSNCPHAPCTILICFLYMSYVIMMICIIFVLIKLHSVYIQPRGQYCDFPPIIFAQNHTDRPDVLNLSINKRACYFQPVLRPPQRPDVSHARPPTTLGQTTPLYYRRPLSTGGLFRWTPQRDVRCRHQEIKSPWCSVCLRLLTSLNVLICHCSPTCTAYIRYTAGLQAR